MAIKIILYIGADNKTGKITEEYESKIAAILSKYWDGFTLHKGRGYWEGSVEESIEVIIYTLNLILKDLHNCITELKVKLVQDKIAYEIVADVDFRLK